MSDIEDLQSDVKELKQNVEYLMQKRLTQVDYIPGSVKQRTMGEANYWVNAGLAANRPSNPPVTNQGKAIWFATDTNVLSVWNGTAWKSTTLT